MTQEDKDLLIKDLSARLPYGVKFKAENEEDIREIFYIEGEDAYIREFKNLPYWVEIIKPYLRSMSSMTKEEKKELSARYVWEITSGKIQIRYHSEGYWDNDTECPTEEYLWLFDWLNVHHFDYRGLIEKELALEAPEGMYKTE